MTWTRKQVEAIAAFTQYVCRKLEIEEWRIKLLDEPTYADPESDQPAPGASIDFVYGRRLANLKLCPDFFTEVKLDSRVHFLVHELCHILVEGVDNVIHNGLERLLGFAPFAILDEVWKVQVELLVDKLAYVLVDLLDCAEFRQLSKGLMV